MGAAEHGAGLGTDTHKSKPGHYIVTLRLSSDGGAGARLQKTIQISPSWVENARKGNSVWLEAEDHSGEGHGSSRIILSSSAYRGWSRMRSLRMSQWSEGSGLSAA